MKTPAIVPDTLSSYQQSIAGCSIASSVSRSERDAYEQALIAGSKAGDTAARERLLFHLLPAVFSQALASYHYLQDTNPDPRVELMDLIAEGNWTLVEHLDRVLQEGENPAAHLLFLTQRAIHEAAHRARSLIATPYRSDVPYSQTLSLSQPPEGFHQQSTGKTDRTWENLLAAPAVRSDTPRDWSPLCEALDELSPSQREVILRHYGIGEQAPQALREIDRAQGVVTGTASQAHRRALNALRVRLVKTPLAPQGPDAGDPLSWWLETTAWNTPHVRPEVALSPDDLRRLDAAFAALQVSGEAINRRSLGRATHMGDQKVRAYLRQHGGALSTHDAGCRKLQYQRMEAAYAALLAEGHTVIGVNQLRERARVSGAAAKLFLTQQGMLSSAERRTQQQQQRLEQAYAALQAEGQFISIRRLSQRAHVTDTTSKRFLAERQRGEQEARS